MGWLIMAALNFFCLGWNLARNNTSLALVCLIGGIVCYTTYWSERED